MLSTSLFSLAVKVLPCYLLAEPLWLWEFFFAAWGHSIFTDDCTGNLCGSNHFSCPLVFLISFRSFQYIVYSYFPGGPIGICILTCHVFLFFILIPSAGLMLHGFLLPSRIPLGLWILLFSILGAWGLAILTRLSNILALHLLRAFSFPPRWG